MKIESMIWYEVIWRNWNKRSGKKKRKMAEQNKKSTFRAFASRANKPFAGKFARDWKKSLKIVSLEKNLANEDSDFGSMFLELLFEPGKFATDWKKSMKMIGI